MDAQVGVGDEHPLGRRRHAAEHRQSPVDPRPESDVLPGLHHHHVGGAGRSARSGPRARWALPGAPFSTTIDRGGAVVEEGAHALGEQRAGIVIDDDGADGSRHCAAQYSLEKRKRTSAASALKPSRQVIFLPSSTSRPA